VSEPFFDKPILNSPYAIPTKHWELDESGQPTHRIKDTRRLADFVTPIPLPKRRRRGEKRSEDEQEELLMGDAAGLSTRERRYQENQDINELRMHLDRWRLLKDPNDWKVSPETARLLQHWRTYKFNGVRPFFCQIEAAEAAIWLMEVAPKMGKVGESILAKLDAGNKEANPGLSRIALKLATGAGKTTVMAMLIAWQTINAVRHPTSKNFTRGFLIVTPGLTIRDRLRVLLPQDPESYYRTRELVPSDLITEVERAKIVITNYHSFRLRERIEITKGTRTLLEGRDGEMQTLETEGQMIQRVMPDLMGLKNILVLNDEAHHCYRTKPLTEEEEKALSDLGYDQEEADRNTKAARLWINGLETVSRKLGLLRVMDLSATPFFLRGSGYPEGTLFPWTMTDFSLMDAIECGIVKLPRVPVADNRPDEEMPIYRNLWEHIGIKMPKKGRASGGKLDPLSLPNELYSALEALYGHYEKTFKLWQDSKTDVPPCFIIVCNNTATSKLIFDYISGFHKESKDGSHTFYQGRLSLFRNFNETGDALPSPVTLLIDSEQLDSGEALDDDFRSAASVEIAQFKREFIERTGDQKRAEKFKDEDLLREVMNTVGKKGRLGGNIRCVVSVSMLTEGWDANTVTHVLGVRAFGTQLLCEQVIGRALRRQSYVLNQEGLFDVEYADVFGIPFDFTAKPVIVRPPPPTKAVQVKAVRPERDALEICFPRVVGYRAELPEEKVSAKFNEDSVLELTPDMVGPSRTLNQGIIGQGVELDLVHTGKVRPSEIIYHLTRRLLLTKWHDPDEQIKFHLFPQLKGITQQWMDSSLQCKGGTYPAQLLYQDLADMACERIMAGISRFYEGDRPIKAMIDPYNPVGSTNHVNFSTSKPDLWTTDARKCHINIAVCDSGWELEFCRVIESHPQVRSYVRNDGLGFSIPYRYGSEVRDYRPDFIIHLDDGQGSSDLLNLIVEIKGYRREDAKEKRATSQNYWVPGVNQLKRYGRWDFLELNELYTLESEFGKKTEEMLLQFLNSKLKKS